MIQLTRLILYNELMKPVVRILSEPGSLDTKPRGSHSHDLIYWYGDYYNCYHLIYEVFLLVVKIVSVYKLYTLEESTRGICNISLVLLPVSQSASSDVSKLRSSLLSTLFHKVINFTIYLNPYHTEFLIWNNPPSINGTFHYHF